MNTACHHPVLQPNLTLADPFLQRRTQHGAYLAMKAFTLVLLLMSMTVALRPCSLALEYRGGKQYWPVSLSVVRMTLRSPTARTVPKATLNFHPSSMPKALSLMKEMRVSAEPTETSVDVGGSRQLPDGESLEESRKKLAAKMDEDTGDVFAVFKNFGKSFGKAVDDMAAGGRRKQKWTRDLRPESQRGIAAGPSENSQLSWGGAKSLAMYEEMVKQFEIESSERAAARLAGQPIGSAAAAMVGESAKASSDLDAEVYDASRVAEAPLGDECNIEGPVELAELIRGKYGRYYDINIKKSKDALNEGVVSLFIYSACLGTRDFPYTEEQWLQKLSNILILLTNLDQAWYVKKFLLSKAEGSFTIVGARLSRPTNDKALTFRLSDSPTWVEPRDTNIFDTWLMMQGVYRD